MTPVLPFYLILAPVAIVLAVVAFRLLFRRGWVLGFLRGLVGLIAVASILFLALFVSDLSAYRALNRESVVATVSFQQIDDRYF